MEVNFRASCQRAALYVRFGVIPPRPVFWRCQVLRPDFADIPAHTAVIFRGGKVGNNQERFGNKPFKGDTRKRMILLCLLNQTP